MTTQRAEEYYLASHRYEQEGKKWTVFNPNNKPIEGLPIIYGFNNGGSPGWYHAQLISEDGMGLGGHVCSHEGYMEHDLGILEGTRSDRHETFEKHYPQGYRMVFIPREQVKGHKGLDKAYELNQKLSKNKKESEEDA